MKPKQLYFGLLGLLVVLVVAIIAGFIWGQKLLDGQIRTLRKISGDISLETGQIERLQSLQADYQKVVPLAEKVQSVLPSQKEQSEVIAQVSTIVASNGLGLSGLTFDKTEGLPTEQSQTQTGKIAGILIMPVRFQSSGSYTKLQSLLQSLERQQRYMRVTTLDIKRDADNGTLTFNITLEVFLKP